MTKMDESRIEQAAEFERMLHTMKAPGGETSMADHPAAKFMVTGYGQGFIHGYQTSAGASHAGLSMVIGQIDAGVLDLDLVKETLIQLRDAIRTEAGL